MMKAKNSAIAIFFIAAVLLQGCQLAKKEAGKSIEGKLIGALVTQGSISRESLNSATGQGRLYAEPIPKSYTNGESGALEISEYIFEGIKGIPYYAYNQETSSGETRITSSDEAISDGHVNVKVGDSENSISLDGTIYILPSTRGPFLINPIYQEENGGIYVSEGTGVSFSGDNAEGVAMSQSLSESYDSTVNGKAKTDKRSINIKIEIMNEPVKISILTMDINSRPISRRDYSPDKMPDVFTPESGASYIVVETYKKGSDGAMNVSYSIYNRGEEWVLSYFSRGDGFLRGHQAKLNWGNDPNGGSIL